MTSTFAVAIVWPFVEAYYVGSPLTLLMLAGRVLTLTGVVRVAIRVAERLEGKLA